NMVVANLFGDYFGDWDSETNPLLPAVLASKGTVLACGWAGRPHWLLQGLATGETMGYCLKETQNAQYNEAYGHFTGESGTQVALLGDPTLRVKIVKPAANLTAVSNCSHVDLHWTASPDPEVLGYLVYRAFDQNGPYTRLTQNAVTGTSWSDPAPVADTLYYSLRAMKWEVTPGGGNFYNTSTGTLKSVIFHPGTGPTVIGLGGELNCTVTSLTLGANFSPNNVTVQWIKPNGALLNGFTATEAGVYTVIATAPNGCTAVAYASVTVDTFLPQPVLPATFILDCTHPTAQFIVPDTSGDVHYTWNGMHVEPGTVIQITGTSVFTVSSTNNGCIRSYPVQVSLDFLAPFAEASSDGHNLDCTHSFVQLMGGSSAPFAQYAWSGNGETFSEQNPVVILPGDYCLTVTGANGCTATDCVQVAATGEEVSVQIIFGGSGPCSNGLETELGLNVLGGTGPFQVLWSNGSTEPSTVFPAGFSGTVGLTVTDAQGCIGNASVTVALPITVLVSKSNPSNSGAADGSIDLLVNGGIAPYAFQWSNGSTDQNLENLSNGTYVVTVTDAAGCSTVLSVSLLTVGTHTPDAAPAIRIAPNPATAIVGVYLTQKESLRLRLTDLAGRTIAVQAGTDSTFFLDTSSLSNGLYLLWVELPTGRRSYKLAVAR
ncbi:MAG: T9SS type A sorting domain-containing protein, partial [Saprospiraceae bacterium]